MAVTKEALSRKLREMYPEIDGHGLDLSLELEEGKGTWVITLSKESHTLSTFLETKDADSCMEGNRCVYLGLHIGQFVENFESHAT